MKYWRETLAIAQRILTELLRRRRSLIFWTIFPVSILILNGFVLSERGELAMEVALEKAAPSSLVGAALFFSCLGGTVATVVAEREQQTLKRLFISPLSGTSYFLGIFLAHSCIGIGQTLLVYIVAGFWGATFQGSILLGIVIIFLSIIAYVGLGFVLGTQLARRTEDVNALVATFGVPLLILGGTFFPSSLFPKTLLDIAKYNPIYHMNEALLGVSANGEKFSDVSLHLRFLLFFATLTLVCGWISYKRMLMVEKRL
ncbi:ABC transporter substrate-binding protein [Cylindrospermopsis raciborskii S07]|jgi:ABC-2 type transport system permease protein|uniref:Transport permease protein n=3 Tax=Cylindrospermopsis raciborskii TaxID=77022 RepID=A0A853MFX8_9CYAN|nr:MULTISPECIES: ABC transporter permease [Cylindrospermopsis]MBU6345766.1 ABC transporter permease [Cyanobacteria bacterium REEB494]KRH98361.1 ABC transporter substrate-binding protein [Cylindrospermopsis sp. CR12]MBA4444374.1 ABC transporter permease [Cylindrospermopsis raciborskii CS-506_C]MBA4448592.1 ABC transporter permease [Cylindrospermopsis raciborskii CS-506_D]MBA4455221.1 ABC transporter permease [Cylindrospermopsis raciborskii CS-506_B]